MWRCFYQRKSYRCSWAIFSTYVEVFLNRIIRIFTFTHFLHVCGGVSPAMLESPITHKFSPRMWRCFHRRNEALDCRKFSPRMWRCFREAMQNRHQWEDFLHVCGGVSLGHQSYYGHQQFSPRMWRCFPKPIRIHL